MRRLLCAAILAVVLHIMVFQMEMPWARPALRLQSQDAVAISLVPAPRPQVRPIPLPASRTVEPLPRLMEKKKAKPVAEPKPGPLNDDEFEPVPQPDEERPPDDEDTEEDMEAPESGGDDLPPDGGPEEPPRETGHASNPSASVEDSPESAAVEVSHPLHDLNPPLSYPQVALRRGYAGVVMLKVLVSREGFPLRIEIETSSGYGVLDRDAVEEVRRWRFKPALRGGVPMEMWIRQPVDYRLE